MFCRKFYQKFKNKKLLQILARKNGKKTQTTADLTILHFFLG